VRRAQTAAGPGQPFFRAVHHNYTLAVCSAVKFAPQSAEVNYWWALHKGRSPQEQIGHFMNLNSSNANPINLSPMNLSRKIVPFLVLCLLQAGDWLSTRAALATPGMVEFNPLVRAMGVGHAKLILVVAAIPLLWYTKKPWHLWALCGFYAVVVASNALLSVIHA
jgi:hypothetical protein